MKDGAVFAVDIYGNERFLTNADDCWQIDSNLYEVGINENWSVIDSNGEYLFSETYDNHEVNEKYIAGSNEDVYKRQVHYSVPVDKTAEKRLGK